MCSLRNGRRRHGNGGATPAPAGHRWSRSGEWSGEGDALWRIAAEEYGDPAQWRPIAAANNITNPRVLEPGTELIIPSI